MSLSLCGRPWVHDFNRFHSVLSLTVWSGMSRELPGKKSGSGQLELKGVTVFLNRNKSELQRLHAHEHNSHEHNCCRFLCPGLQVTEKLAESLGLDDHTKLRLTQHNSYSGQPQRNPLKWRGMATLDQMLQHSHHVNDVVYYDVLDIPLPELETLKTLKVGRGRYISATRAVRLTAPQSRPPGTLLSVLLYFYNVSGSRAAISLTV